MRIALYVALSLLISTHLQAQVPVAAFTASKTSGCAPLVVTFTDQSTGNPQFWNWDLGNNIFSNLQNPTIVFSQPGVYSITLIVRNGNGPAGITKTNYITVNPSPSVNFKVNSQIGCSPSTFQFTDLSFDTAGTITKWNWTFSDGTSSTAQNPSKQFTATGFYDVGLTVTSSTGCSASGGSNRYIRIVPGVKADFTDTLPAVCRPPFQVIFNNQTSGPGILSYAWDFGNSTSSTQTNPTAVYNSAGNYTVKLTAQSDYGCQGSVQKTVTLSANAASFTSPDSVCKNSPVSFSSTSAPPPTTVLWKFGDGTQSTQTSPVKNYSSPGTYTVTMIGNYASCTDSATKNIVVRTPPVVSFTSPKNKSCKPFTVSFTDTSPDASSWQWDFGDGGTATTKNPTHAYAAAGEYDVTLTITDSKGCQNTITQTKFVQIVPPVAVVANTPAGGCAPFTFSPVSNSTQIDGIVDYTWDFGDGTVLSGPAPTANHTYLSPGNYTLKLTVTTTDGCSNTATIVNAVKVGSHTLPDFTKNVTNVCHSSTVTFTNTSSPVGDETKWLFGDGGISTSIDTAQHKYADSGTFTVTLININNGCPDTMSKPAFITVLPPVANFTYTVDCNQKNQAIFTDSSIINPALPAPAYKWNFDDAGATATGTAATHLYPAVFPASYNVQYIVDDGTCADTIVKKVQIVNEPATFNISKATACRNEDIQFTALAQPQNIAAYQWTITYPNGTIVTRNMATFSLAFTAVGNYQVQLVVTDIHNCVTPGTPKFVNITGPVANFTIANNGGCSGANIQFTDNSVSAVGSITRWNWNFGDASPAGTTQNPTHSYSKTGGYGVALTVTDNLGCSDTYTDTATVTRPVAAFSTDTTLFCPGAPMTFKDLSQGVSINGWTWYFGDGGSSNQKNPVHTYAGGDSAYSVKLVVSDAFGCADSTTRTNYVTIKKPKPAFGVQDSTTICPPLETKFFFQGKDYESYYWDFGDGGTSSLLNPTHFFNSYGSDTVKLYLVGYGGCLDSVSSVVNVYNPNIWTIIDYPPPYTACNQLNVNFTFTIPPSTKSYFYFGDGLIDSSQQKNLQHFYNNPSFYAPFVMITDNQGCIANVGGSNTIRILGALPLFGPDKKKFCDSGVVAFTNFSLANDPVMQGIWDYGDGSKDIILPPTDINHTNAVHNFRQPGLYVVTLTDSTQASCVRSYSDTIRVLRTPDLSINSDDAVCLGNNIDFQGVLAVPDTAISWKWDFGNGQTSVDSQFTANYNKAGSFTVFASAANSLGCKDTTSKTILVNPLPAVTITGDTTLLVGLGITIPVSYSANVMTYSWTPADHLSCTDCANPYANPKFTTTYRVTVTDDNNCSSSRDITLITLCNNKNFFIPNTFSPNKDGNNDIFYPRGTGIDRIQAMRIFNRWGELVFEKRFFPANDASSGWDGSYKGKLAMTDTYIYMIDIICENATIITYKGNVTLVR